MLTWSAFHATTSQIFFDPSIVKYRWGAIERSSAIQVITNLLALLLHACRLYSHSVFAEAGTITQISAFQFIFGYGARVQTNVWKVGVVDAAE
jgi:hypothetical protein